MDMQIGLVLFSITLAVLSVASSVICVMLMLRNKNLIDALVAQVDEFDNEFREAKELYQEGNHRAVDHARRIAWLETRIRKPEKATKDEFRDDVFAPKRSGTANMTERRHRVLTLAQRGQDASAIATALGMLIGEVDLIMRLGRGSNHYA